MNRRELFAGLAGAIAAPAVLVRSVDAVVIHRLADLEAYERAASFDAFTQAMIRQISQGLGVPYEMLVKEFR